MRAGRNSGSRKTIEEHARDQWPLVGSPRFLLDHRSQREQLAFAEAEIVRQLLKPPRVIADQLLHSLLGFCHQHAHDLACVTVDQQTIARWGTSSPRRSRPRCRAGAAAAGIGDGAPKRVSTCTLRRAPAVPRPAPTESLPGRSGARPSARSCARAAARVSRGEGRVVQHVLARRELEARLQEREIGSK